MVNHHTLSDFRVDHQEALDQLFAQLLAILSSEGLITLEQVVHDGTKVKAAASGQSMHREKTLRAHLEAAQQRVQAMGDPREEAGDQRRRAARQRAAREKVERLEQALEELQKVQAAPEARKEKSERRASETDPEARVMKQGDGGYAVSHNVQISTDTAHAIIVAASVTQEASDQQQLVPAVEEVERQNGRAPGQMIVDEGYTTRENVLAAAERGVDLIGSTMQPKARSGAAALGAARRRSGLLSRKLPLRPGEQLPIPVRRVRSWRIAAPDADAWGWCIRFTRRARPTAGIVRCARGASRASRGA